MADPVTVTPVEGIGIATVMARKGADLAAIAAALGQPLPQGSGATFAAGRTVLGAGPGVWLLFEDAPAPDFAETLERDLAGLAAVSDQSGSYWVEALAGPQARPLLQRGLAIDLDPPAFTAGSAAISQIAHIGVVAWQTSEAPAYRIATFRSMEQSWHHWLAVTTASLAILPVSG